MKSQVHKTSHFMAVVLLTLCLKPLVAVLQLGSSLFFIFLIFCVDLSSKALQRSTTNYKNLFNPVSTVVPGIPACEDGFFIKKGCYDFIWIGSSTPRLELLVTNIRKNNPNRPIPENKVRVEAIGSQPLGIRFILLELDPFVLFYRWSLTCYKMKSNSTLLKLNI